MKIGKNIILQRKKKNLSQEELALLLEVSRQSVSKWENDVATPDLDKIIKLSEIFEITMDELIKGEETEPPKEVQIVREVVIQPKKTEGRKIVGSVLLGIGILIFLLILLLAGSIGGIFYALPFFGCSIICFTVERNTGLWCAWAIYLSCDLLLRIATGITISLVFHTLHYTPSMNYMRLAIAWLFLAVTLILVFITVKKFTKAPLELTAKNKKKVLFGWIIWAALYLFDVLFHRINPQLLLSIVMHYELAYTMTHTLLYWLRNFILILTIISSIKYYKMLKGTKLKNL